MSNTNLFCIGNKLGKSDSSIVSSQNISSNTIVPMKLTHIQLKDYAIVVSGAIVQSTASPC